MSHSLYKTSLQTPIPLSVQEISIKEILKRHSDDPELLKCILTAKSEEDKKKAARDVLKTEKMRIQLRHIDMELAREQYKIRYPYRYEPYQPSAPPTAYSSSAPHSASLQSFPVTPFNTAARHSIPGNESSKTSGAPKTQAHGKSIKTYHTATCHESLKKSVLPPIDTKLKKASFIEENR